MLVRTVFEHKPNIYIYKLIITLTDLISHLGKYWANLGKGVLNVFLKQVQSRNFMDKGCILSLLFHEADSVFQTSLAEEKFQLTLIV
jgi:hypothetical protein